jgi:endoglycosylceramidase
MNRHFFLLALLFPAYPVLSSSSLHLDGPSFKDASNRIVTLRGLNVSTNFKIESYKDFSDTRFFHKFTEAGINVIRLLFNWETYEPIKGKRDADYLKWYASVAADAWKEGIYTIADFHQDAYSTRLLNGCGEGFPEWTIPDSIKKSNPDNGPKCRNWGTLALFSYGAKGDLYKVFQAFSKDVGDAARSHYVAVWKDIALALKDNPGVIGYDLLNEPWLDESLLAPLYEEVAAAIHSVDKTALLFLEPNSLTNGSPASQSQMLKPRFYNFVYAPHLYDPVVHSFSVWGKDSTTMNQLVDNMKQISQRWKNDGNNGNGAPIFIGEFGVSENTINGLAFLDALYEKMDANHISGAQWAFASRWTPEKYDGWNLENFSVVDEKWGWRKNFRPQRPYVQKLSGDNLEINYKRDAEGKLTHLSATWDFDPSKGPTEIYFPKSLAMADRLELKTHKELTCDFINNDLILKCASKYKGRTSIEFNR